MASEHFNPVVPRQDRPGEFERHRPRLFGIAYRMLGSRADAEDVLQDAYLRWHRSAGEVRSPEAWLVTAVTRLCIDRLRALRAEREHYVGPWLPEPLIGEATAPAADQSAELSSSLSIAFLVVLEQLAPDERAAFLLREVFDTGYPEIARILGKSEAASRQLVSRARKRVREQRPRGQVSEAARRAVLGRFVHAVQTQDRTALLSLLAEGASWTSDGGGETRAALKVIRGRERVVRFVLAVLGRHTDVLAFEPITVNGEPALAIRNQGRLFSVITVRTDGVRILDVYTVLNPKKLAASAPAVHG